MQSVAGLTRHVKSGVVCQVNKSNRQPCTNRTWELCDKCDRPVCGQHVLAHYRLAHPRML